MLRPEDPIRFSTRSESNAGGKGPAIQIMHIGRYADEPATPETMDAFAEENGCELYGRHHEIYLGDPTRAKPEKLKTILRHPIRT